MDTDSIFGLQFVLSIGVWAIIAGFMLAPWLSGKSKSDALAWLTLPHMFRHLGMAFLVPGVVDQPLPDGFANPAAYGDLATGVLALIAFVALKSGWKVKFTLVWVFNLVGTIDLVNALRHTDVAPLMGATWFIPTMFVPLLLVTHVMIFARLMRGEQADD